MNRVVFTRSHDIAADSRLQKYVSVLRNSRVPNRAIYWNRQGNPAVRDYDLAFRMNAKVGAGANNFLKLIVFNLWLLNALVRQRKTYDCIHAVDLDTILPSLIASILLKKRLIYDVYDVYSASRNVRGRPGQLLDKLERLCVSWSDYCILPAQTRATQLQIELTDKVKIIENVPMPTVPAGINLNRDELGAYRAVFSYVGIFERAHRGIEDFLRFFEDNPEYALLIAGYGELASAVEDASKRLENVIYFGSVPYSQAAAIMAHSDAILGFYYDSVPNHRYASPNKYYEHLMFGKPLFTSKRTPPGRLVEEHQTGVAIADGYESLREAFTSTDLDDIATFSANAQALWEKKFKNYFSDSLAPTYLSMLG